MPIDINKNNKLIFFLMGPTGSGKSDFAVSLAKKLPLEIVNIDSALVYKEMDIGTAKPTKQMQQQVTHHLIDILNPTANYSAEQCLKLCKKKINEIRSRSKVPILVGGTMLYFKIIYQGVACIPQIPPAIRAELAKNLEEQGWDKLQADLAKVDLVGASRIQKNDKQRLLRALEVYHATGKTLDYWWQQSPTAGLADDNQIIQIALIPANRQQLYTQINKRFDLMLKQGLLREVAGLLDKYKLSIKHNSMRSVGYRQVLGYLAGELSHEQMQQQATRATRNLAKRQLTWLRNWRHPLLRVSLTSYEATLAELSKIILHKLS